MKSVHAAYYSPTATSRKIAMEVAVGLADSRESIKEHELTLPLLENVEIGLAADDLAVIAVPVYAGRVAPLAAKRLQSLQGDDTPAVIVVLYGNRDYEDALPELYDLVSRRSFRVVAAAAFIGEHSFSSADTPIAQGRPDSDDLAVARDFAGKLRQKLADTSRASCERSSLPGNDPYKEAMGNIPLTPAVDESRCTLCGECLDVCPAGAIELSDRMEIRVESCTFCCACIKSCPEGAVSLGVAGPISEKKQWLHEHCAERKNPEFFL